MKKTALAIKQEADIIEPALNITKLLNKSAKLIEKFDDENDEILDSCREEVKLLRQILRELKSINRKLTK